MDTGNGVSNICDDEVIFFFFLDFFIVVTSINYVSFFNSQKSDFFGGASKNLDFDFFLIIFIYSGEKN